MSTELATFNFHGDELDIVKHEGEHHVTLARLCEVFDLGRDEQVKKLKKLPWARTVKITVRDSAGKPQEMVCLPIRSVAGWLFTINAGKVKTELREKLALYQSDCADVLADHFLGKRGALAVDDSAEVAARAAVILRPILAAEMAPIRQELALLAPIKEDLAMLGRGVSAIGIKVSEGMRELGAWLDSNARGKVTEQQIGRFKMAVARVVDGWIMLGWAQRSTRRSAGGEILSAIYRRAHCRSITDMPVTEYENAMDRIADMQRDVERAWRAQRTAAEVKVSAPVAH